MKYIDKIEIQYFRSFKFEKVSAVSELNIISGKNDSGKSNILKALDLFFNPDKCSFIYDYNKERLEEVRKDTIKGKQYISIKIHFINPGGFKTLPDKFYVNKTWDRTGKVISEKNNLKQQFEKGKTGTSSLNKSYGGLTRFLNKIQFTYVPAVKDEKFFYYLLEILQFVLFEQSKKSKGKIDLVTKEFNDELNSITEQLSSEFQQITGINTTLNFPSEISELFQRLIIDTETGTHKVPLQNRGDGIRMRYIPTILNYIAKNSTNFHIWGFDEPENSCEYSLSNEMSKSFCDQYIANSQIFIVTHSFHFISLESPKISKYRVFKDEQGISSNIISLDSKNKEILEDEIGILQINKELAELYKKLIVEREEITSIREKLKNTNRPYLIFEGPSDNSLFSTAFKELKSSEIGNSYVLCDHLKSMNGSTVGSSANDLNKYLHSHIAKTPLNNTIIGIFDFDREGINELKALKKSKLFVQYTGNGITFNNVLQHKDMKNVFAITIVPPSFRSDFVHASQSQYCLLTTELLLQDINIPIANKQYPSLFERRVFSFSGKKVAFSDKIKEKVDNGETIDFTGFQPTIELIEKIVSI